MDDSDISVRVDLMSIFNAAHFSLHHYAKGYYPTSHSSLTSLPNNRFFFPLANPNGQANFVEYSAGRYTLTPGKMYFVPAFLPVKFRLDHKLYFLSIHTRLEIFPGVDFFSGCQRILEMPTPPEFEKLMAIFDSDDSDCSYQNAFLAGSLAFSILARMTNYYNLEDFWAPMALRKYVNLVDYLKQNANASTSVSELSEMGKTSRENFTRHFTADTKMTPKQLIDRFVTMRCISLIEQGYSFKETAHRLRFRDEFAFSRYFKRNMGVSPRDWRKNSNL